MVDPGHVKKEEEPKKRKKEEDICQHQISDFLILYLFHEILTSALVCHISVTVAPSHKSIVRNGKEGLYELFYTDIHHVIRVSKSMGTGTGLLISGGTFFFFFFFFFFFCTHLHVLPNRGN